MTLPDIVKRGPIRKEQKVVGMAYKNLSNLLKDDGRRVVKAKKRSIENPQLSKNSRSREQVIAAQYRNRNIT